RRAGRGGRRPPAWAAWRAVSGAGAVAVGAGVWLSNELKRQRDIALGQEAIANERSEAAGRARAEAARRPELSRRSLDARSGSPNPSGRARKDDDRPQQGAVAQLPGPPLSTTKPRATGTSNPLPGVPRPTRLPLQP